MILAITVAVVAAIEVLLVIGRVVTPAYRRYRGKAELREDWWPRFERELREYMSYTWREAREAERQV